MEVLRSGIRILAYACVCVRGWVINGVCKRRDRELESSENPSQNLVVVSLTPKRLAHSENIDLTSFTKHKVLRSASKITSLQRQGKKMFFLRKLLFSLKKTEKNKVMNKYNKNSALVKVTVQKREKICPIPPKPCTRRFCKAENTGLVDTPIEWWKKGSEI